MRPEQTTPAQAFGTYRWLLKRRQWADWWGRIRRGGAVGIVLYVVGFALLGVVSLWQTYRFAAPAPDPALVAALATVFWLSTGLARRPALGLNASDLPLLRLPLRPATVLRAALWRVVARHGLAGLVAGALVWAWFPAWWPLAAALPLLAVGRVMLHSLLYDARLTKNRHAGWWALATALSPLLGAAHPVGLPLAAGVGVVAGWTLWMRFWATDFHIAPLHHAAIEGLRREARRLGLPVPDVGPDGVPAPRRWPLPLRWSGPFAAALWRSALHLTRRPLLLLAAPLAGGVVGVGSPLLLALGLGPLLGALGPPLPERFPLSTVAARLTRSLPAGLVLGALLAAGAGGSAALGLTPAVSVLVALVAPWTGLAVLAWLGHAPVGTTTTDGQLRVGAALAPAMAAFLCTTLGLPALAPLAVLAVGLLATLAGGGAT